MKTIGAILLTVSAALFVVWIVAWVALVTEHGLVDGVEVGLHVWPGNLIGFLFLAFSILFCLCGFSLMNHGPQSR
jgi:hypothetical protein